MEDANRGARPPLPGSKVPPGSSPVGTDRYGERMSVASLELDLDLFSGPFDLLLTLILREEVDLLELQLADVVLAYLDHLEAQGELDLETATEFIVLIAALLELKSRLMLSGEEEDELLDIEPAQAAEELLERMLEARRYRAAAGHLGELLAREEGVRFREAPLPASLRKTVTQPTDGSQNPDLLGEAIGRLLAMPPAISLRHIGVPRVSVAERLAHLRALLRRGSFSFDEAVQGADRMTVAVTLFALLELYKCGEADWSQGECFGEIAVHSARPGRSRVRALSAAASLAERAREIGVSARPAAGRESPLRRCAPGARPQAPPRSRARRGAAVPVLRAPEPGGAGRSDGGRPRSRSRRRSRALAEQYAPGGAASRCASWEGAGHWRATRRPRTRRGGC